MLIDTSLVRRLVASQFPQWKDLSVLPVERSGWDNRTFHLGDRMLVRMPSSEDYVAQVEKEHAWLPKLAPYLPLSIPEPLAIGSPGEGYPWKWSIYRWLQGETAAVVLVDNLCDLAKSLAQFLVALERIGTVGGPISGPHSFYRGGSLKIYDNETRRAIEALDGRIDVNRAMDIWNSALSTSWNASPVWVHGDISAGNLLVQNGKLTSVIDFGQLTVGDPACDLAIAWTLLHGESREVFRSQISLDEGTWIRGEAWALWKALIVAAGFTNPNNTEAEQCWRVLEEILGN
jgi:aminoglycoside phosphotransferase (APT) family kinase protein